MEKKVARGTYQIAICHEYNLVAVQWKDSRIVNHLSSYLDLGVGNVKRRTGQETISVPCPKAIMHYQENMGGVDRADQMRSHFGGFATKGHFKKWYKKTLMAVIDCMLHNGRLMWNMSVDSDYGRAHGRKPLERYEFMHLVAQELLNFRTQSLVSPRRRQRNLAEREDVTTTEADVTRTESVNIGGHGTEQRPSTVETKSSSRCVVCQLEWSLARTAINNFEKETKIVVSNEQRRQLLSSVSEGCRKGLSTCLCCQVEKTGVGLMAHTKPVLADGKKRIHSLFPDGMSCMEILHSEVGRELWKREGSTGKTSSSRRFSCTVSRNHDYVKELRQIITGEVTKMFSS